MPFNFLMRRDDHFFEVLTSLRGKPLTDTRNPGSWLLNAVCSVLGALCVLDNRGHIGFPGGAIGKEPPCQCRRRKRPRVGKILWRKAWQPTPAFYPWRIPWTEEPGGLQSMGSQRVGHDWATKYTRVISEVPTSRSQIWLCQVVPGKWV